MNSNASRPVIQVCVHMSIPTYIHSYINGSFQHVSLDMSYGSHNNLGRHCQVAVFVWKSQIS